MSKVILEAGKTAEHAFYLNKLSASIRSVEELCYLIHEETVFIDAKLFSEKLIHWLDEECRLEDLAASLYRLHRAKGSAAAFATTILNYVGMYPIDDVQTIELFLKKNASLHERDRRKNMGDYLARKERYEAAIREYLSLLQATDESDHAFRALLLHNMGYCYGNLFLFSQAQDCFRRAYELSGSRESRAQYLATIRMQMTEEDYISFVAANADTYYDVSMDVEKTVEAGKKRWENSEVNESTARLAGEKDMEPEEYARQVHFLTNRLVEKYRKMMEEC